MLDRVPDLDSLQLLLAVAELGSVGAAARSRGLSQPAGSARIRTVERLVGLPLVTRGARGSRLTPAGLLVADWARDVLAAAAVLDAGVRALRDTGDRQLRVAASMTVAEHLLPRWLARFAAGHPETAVRVTAAGSAQVMADVLAGVADLGFVEGPDLLPGLSAVVVATDRLVVVVPPKHPWTRRRRRLEASELAAARLVQREIGSGTREALARALGQPLAAPAIELSTTSAVRAAVLAGAGVAAVSELAVRDDVAAGRLVVVPVVGVDLSRELRAVRPTGPLVAGPVRDLLALVRAAPGLSAL